MSIIVCGVPDAHSITFALDKMSVRAILSRPETKFGPMPRDGWSADWTSYISGSLLKAAIVSGLSFV